jgi:hypothetical protein
VSLVSFILSGLLQETDLVLVFSLKLMVQIVQACTPGTQEQVQTTARIATMVPKVTNEKLNANQNE